MDFASSFVDSDNLPEAIGSGNLGTVGLGRLASLQLTGSVVGRVALTDFAEIVAKDTGTLGLG